MASSDPIQKYRDEIDPRKQDKNTHNGPQELGIMGALDLLFSIGNTERYEQTRIKYGLGNNVSAAATKPGWVTDIWTRLQEIQEQNGDTTPYNALRILNGHTTNPSGLLRPDLLEGITAENALQKSIQDITKSASKHQISPALIVNLSYDPGKQDIDVKAAKALIDDIDDMNEITGNATLSYLTIQSGGQSHAEIVKDDKVTSPAHVSLLDRVLTQLQNAENTTNPDNPKQLTYDDIKPKAPAHLALIHDTLKDMGHDNLMYDVLAQNSNFWPLEKRQNAEELMHQNHIDVAQQQTNLTNSWHVAMNDPDPLDPTISTPRAPEHTTAPSL